MTELRLEGVSKRYGASGSGAADDEDDERTGERRTVALEGVDLTVRDGEFFTLVGPSGCGKTTTLRTIAGFEEPTTGVVTFDGESMAGVPPERRNIGVVFQSYALFPHMNVAENVAYGLQFQEPPAGTTSDERVSELLELVDLSGMGHRDPDQLSGGQQQRVALARALAPQPELLLLDEPMSALDARLRESLRLQLAQIQSELGITTVYVTHDQEEALAISDRLAVLNRGRVEQIGTPQQIYHEPATRFVADFVGDNNVFDGSVRHSSGDRIRVTVDGVTFELGSPVDRTADPIGPPTDRERDRVSFCVRPEALTRTADRNRFSVAVETCEFLGESVRVHGCWNEVPIVLRLSDVPDGEEVTVGFDPADARLLNATPSQT
ncbi:ABC transporter ATP-binding protein [Natrarchaeobius halalkaliphilus]|uniref:Molybdate/tungstate import ATP-binding protein WtpC n=1 Tax=Natrarchaeobius halalkaliphilus TaxID=1679091 RepID=A0A3N6LX41_9EURY|nr:ABC transporter ATP-binding protein [Natrarchaeobius halalkaliphilus]RQG86177.1 ABC transporter ATP-binding protein [Natrarchaeobius halalkaliphilus]